MHDCSFLAFLFLCQFPVKLGDITLLLETVIYYLMNIIQHMQLTVVSL